MKTIIPIKVIKTKQELEEAKLHGSVVYAVDVDLALREAQAPARSNLRAKEERKPQPVKR